MLKMVTVRESSREVREKFARVRDQVREKFAASSRRIRKFADRVREDSRPVHMVRRREFA